MLLDAIRQCRLFVYALSPESVASADRPAHFARTVNGPGLGRIRGGYDAVLARVLSHCLGHKASLAVDYAGNRSTEDHVHLVAAIPPRIAAGKFVGDVKGRSSYFITHNLAPDFAWQAGYGLHTFAEKNLLGVMRYVLRQKEHHAQNTVKPHLEACQDDHNGPPHVLPDS